MAKGSVFLIAGSVIFWFGGLVIHFGIGHWKGEGFYGDLTVILAINTLFSLVLGSGFAQAASKYIAEDNARLGSIVGSCIRLQVVLSVFVFGLYFGLAGPVANLFNDPELATYIRVSAFAVPVVSLFSVYGAGFLNGLKRFEEQSKTKVANAVIKVVAVFALIGLGLGLEGAILGYILAPLFALLLARKYLGKVEKEAVTFPWRKLVTYAAPVMLFQVMVTSLLATDLLAVKALLGNQGLIGDYGAANNLAKLPYFFLAGGLAAALLPSVSMSTFKEDTVLTRNYIAKTMRYVLIVLVPSVAVVAAMPSELVNVTYGTAFLEAAEPLGLLFAAFGLLTVFFVLCSVLMGAGKPHVALAMVIPLVVLDISLNLALVPKYHMMGAAAATAVTCLLGAMTACVYVRWHFGVLVRPKSVIKIVLASAAVYILALQISIPSFASVSSMVSFVLSLLILAAAYLGLVTLYGALLWTMRELDREDLRIVNKILPRDRIRELEE
jgi:O-antigen/teichoic acid export membrane protein